LKQNTLIDLSYPEGFAVRPVSSGYNGIHIRSLQTVKKKESSDNYV